MNKQDIVIFGGGLTGLTCGWKLAQQGYRITIFEKESFVGGISSTFKHKDYYLDYGPHKIYTQLNGILDEIKLLLGEDLLEIEKRSSIRIFGQFLKYPVQIKDLVRCLPIQTGIECVFSYLWSVVKNKILPRTDDSYESWVTNRFGRVIYSLVFETYAKKIWGDPSMLSSDLARARIILPNLKDVFLNTIFGKQKEGKELSAKKFYYPKYGIIQLSEKIAEAIKDNGSNVFLNSFPVKVLVRGLHAFEIVYRINNTEEIVHTSKIISTIPLNSLVDILMPQVPVDIKLASDNLKYRGLILIYIVFDVPSIIKDNWIFFPEEKYSFNRISEQKSFSNTMIPSNKTVLTVEITCNRNDEDWLIPDKKLFEKVMVELKDTGITSTPSDYLVKRLAGIYPVYDLKYSENLNKILMYLDSINIYTIGRHGLFNYNNMDHCIDMGIRLASYMKSGEDMNRWKDIRKGFSKYQIVD